VFVFVVQDTRVAKRRIRTGQRRVGTVEVLEGLRAGDLVVTEGTQKLRDGASVRLVNGGATDRSVPGAGQAATR